MCIESIIRSTYEQRAFFFYSCFPPCITQSHSWLTKGSQPDLLKVIALINVTLVQVLLNSNRSVPSVPWGNGACTSFRLPCLCGVFALVRQGLELRFKFVQQAKLYCFFCSYSGTRLISHQATAGPVGVARSFLQMSIITRQEAVVLAVMCHSDKERWGRQTEPNRNEKFRLYCSTKTIKDHELQ